MKYTIFTIVFLLVFNTLVGEKLSKDQKEYLSIYGGYYKDLVRKNEKLTKESIKLGVKVYGKKDAGKNNSYQEYLVKKETGPVNPDFAKYDNILNEYYYPQLELLHKCREKVDLATNSEEKAIYEQELKDVNIYFEIILDAISSNILEYKIQTCNLMKMRGKYESLNEKPDLSRKEEAKLKRLRKSIDQLIEKLQKTPHYEKY
jgi:hypothetical protein